MFSTFVTAISNLIKSVFDFKAVKIKNLACIDIVEDKKDYKKATDIAEKIIAIAENYKQEMTFSHRLKFCHLVESFKRFN